MIIGPVRAKFIISTVLLIAVPAIVGFGQYLLIGYTSVFPSLDFIPLWRFFIIAALIEAVIAYFIGDAYTAEYRHRVKLFHQPLPAAEQTIIRNRRLPFLIGAGFNLVLGIVMGILMSF